MRNTGYVQTQFEVVRAKAEYCENIIENLVFTHITDVNMYEDINL